MKKLWKLIPLLALALVIVCLVHQPAQAMKQQSRGKVFDFCTLMTCKSCVFLANMDIYHNLSRMVAMPSGYYFFGGYDMNAKELTVLMVEPGKHPKVTKIKDDLDSLQKAVSIGADYQGLIEFVSLGNGDCIMCNEEGKLIGLDGNRRLGNDILVGVIYIMSENEDGELLSLTDAKIKRYTELFWEPEAFDRAEIEETMTCHFI